MTRHQAFAEAERRLFAHYGLDYATRILELNDPAVAIGVRESGSGEPVGVSDPHSYAAGH